MVFHPNIHRMFEPLANGAGSVLIANVALLCSLPLGETKDAGVLGIRDEGHGIIIRYPFYPCNPWLNS